MKVLLLGANGQVGWELVRALSGVDELVTTARTGDVDVHLDVADLRQLHAVLESVAPDVVVNAIAYTAVDKAESEPDSASLLNAEVPRLIGQWAAANDALVIHYSTDYVFDGSKKEPYVETDQPNPVSVYGRTKLAGDEALMASGCAAVILRVSWVYGLRGQNFLLTMRRLMAERDELSIVDDQFGAPSWCRSIAQLTSLVLKKMPSHLEQRQAISGVYHFAPEGFTSWYGFAVAIRAADAVDCRLSPIPASSYPTPAKRPANSRMDTGKLRRVFGFEPNPWEADLSFCLGDGN